MLRPLLIVVSGPPGSGKTTLAHTLARAVGCPAICRDEIKEGLVHSTPDYVPALDDVLARRTYDTFFQVLELLLRAGTTVVAEAAFQDRVWGPRLQHLADLADIRVVECVVDDQTGQARQAMRDNDSAVRQEAHVAGWRPANFAWISLPVLKLRVDTTDGYSPTVADIVALLDAPRSSNET